jgi:hypothetical protein
VFAQVFLKGLKHGIPATCHRLQGCGWSCPECTSGGRLRKMGRPIEMLHHTSGKFVNRSSSPIP